MTTVLAPPAEQADVLDAIGSATVASRMLDAAREHGDWPALVWYDGEVASSLTWSAYRVAALEVAAGFVALGVAPGETVAFMLGNRVEHLLADLGALHAGAIGLTVYATLAPDQVAFIARDAGVSVAVLEGAEQVTRFAAALDAGQVTRAIVVDASAIPAGDTRFISWAEFVSLGSGASAADRAAVDARWQAITQSDPVTLLYTSGTTGTPKGVLLTHRNVLYESECVRRLSTLTEQAVSVGYLPLAHVAERNLSIYSPIHRAGCVHLCPDPTQLAGVLRRARPTSFFAVPRVWEKLQSGLSGVLALEPSAEKREALASAMRVGAAHVHAREAGGEPSAELEASFADVDSAVLAPLRAALGLDRTIWFSSGSAPLAGAVTEWFAGLGIAICDVFGMTETCGAITANRLTAFKLGTVGQPAPGCEARIADDGEVLVRGPVTTPGYHGRSDLTAELYDADGWLRTGDIGTIDAEGYVKIVDRKKELIITSGGENIAPALVEAALKEDPLIGQAMAIGDGRNYLSALLVLDAEALPGWLATRELASMPVDEAASSPEVLAAVEVAVARANEGLARVQQVKRWTLLGREWTAESGELTPTLKLRRRVVLDRYAAEIDAL